MNWARAINDDWLHHNLLYTPPPTSDGYLAPVVGFDDPEPASEPIDELEAQITSDVVVHMGLHNIDHYRVLVYYYPHLMAGEHRAETTCLKALAKHMHCSFSGAERMLIDAVSRYWDYRQTVRDKKKKQMK